MKYLIVGLFLLASISCFPQDGSFEIKTEKGKKISVDFNVKGLTDPDPWENRVIPIFLLVAGSAMMLFWGMDMSGNKSKEQGSLFDWRSDGGDHLWLHILAEFLTAGLLIAAGIGLLGQNLWGYRLAYISLGALCYTSLNSLGWVFAQKSRLSYGIPIIIGLVGGITSLIIILS